MSSEHDYLLVAAIDFGTTYSGYGLSFKNAPEDILVNKNWGAELGFQAYKTPSTVLTDSSGDFVAFGFDAEQEYSQAVDEGEDTHLMLFRHFKMMLYDIQNIKRTSRAFTSSLDGTDLSAMDVFTHALRFLKDHLLNALKNEIAREVDPSMIRWVITVPAIWKDEAKQFMREAAYKAGCIATQNSPQLLIALEPEAASLCCRRHNIAQYAASEDANFPTGTKYLVLDCGGGTVDITAHTTEHGNRVKELMAPTGGPWGSTEVDKNFISLLRDVLGDRFIDEYKNKHPAEWLAFTTNFEKVKKALKGDGKAKLTVPLTWSMSDLHKSLHEGQKIEQALKGAKDKGVGFANGALMIKNEAAMKLFNPVIKQILDHLNELLEDPVLSDLSYIFMVGGFSECQVLQDAVKQAYIQRGIRVLVPSSAQLAVIRGATLFGHTPTEIASRRARFTYGISTVVPFDPDIHQEQYKYKNSEGEKFCGNIFEAFVEKGEEVVVGEKRKIHFGFGFDQQRGEPFGLRLFRLIGKPWKIVQYTSDPRMDQVGLIPLDNMYKRGRCTPPFTVVVEFGGTEIGIELIDDATGESVTSTVNFVSEH